MGSSLSRRNLIRVVGAGVVAQSGFGQMHESTDSIHSAGEAAEQGRADTQYNLGLMYEKGRGMAQNYTEASRWYQKAAEQGHAKAQSRLGALYEEGRGVPQNFALEAVS